VEYDPKEEAVWQVSDTGWQSASVWHVVWGDKLITIDPNAPPPDWKTRLRWRVDNWRYAITDRVEAIRWQLAESLERVADRIKPRG
jgi:hypothetical protein